jgi:ankyrin repeat protein
MKKITLILFPFISVLFFGCLQTNSFVKVARYGNVQEAEVLIKNGVDINKKGLKGATPLMDAVSYGNAPMVEFLLSKGADVFAYDNSGYMALSYAVSYGIQKEILDMLIRAEEKYVLKNNGNPLPVVTSLIRKTAKCMGGVIIM